MTIAAAVKRHRRELIATHIPELDQPWYVEAFAAVVAPLYLLWLGLGLRWSR